MRIVKTVEELRETGPLSLALGAFDGLHRGHMAVLREASAPPFREAWGAVSFESSPFGGPAVLTSEDKEALLRELGASLLVSFRFPEVRDMSAEDFVQKVLFERCHAAKLACGEDFRFGRGGAGDVSLLRRLCEERGAALTVVSPVLENGEKISSTAIRAAVGAGDIPLANRLLGRPFGYALEVIHGNHIGTGLGAPTINQAMPQGFALPPFGVYASLVRLGGQELYGVTNIGVKPTVGSDRVLSETWIPQYAGNLYGRRVRVSLLQFIRPEKKFASLTELRAEIEKNAEEARKIAEIALQNRGTVLK